MVRLAARQKIRVADMWEHEIEKKSHSWSGRRESNPHDQLGRLELYH